MDRLVFLTIIAGRKQKDALLSALTEQGVQLTCTIYGRGAANAGLVKSMLGLTHEENKALITCVLKRRHVDAIFQMLTEQFHFDKPNTGIAFIRPIDNLSF